MYARTGLALVVAAIASATGVLASSTVSVDGYLDFKKPSYWIVDGQRIEIGAKTMIKGGKNASDVPLGYRIKVAGTRAADGTIVAMHAEAIKNGMEFMEKDVINGTNQAEQAWVQTKAVSQSGAEGKQSTIGALVETGPQVDRCRRIVDRLLPPYVDPKQVRVYVVENKEWNAMAMANYSIYVFSGLMKDMDNDELAIVLGHEIAHATYEHSRRQAKGSVFSGIAGQLAALGAQKIHSDTGRAAAQQATALSVTTFSNTYSRESEDQADRVGLRYVYEGGYDFRKAPGLWMKFANKYGDQDKVSNFFFGDHSLSAKRAKNLQAEIDRNYSNLSKDPPLHAQAAPTR